MSEISFKLTAGTDVGLERSNNEDNFIVNADLTHKEWFVPQSDDLVSLGDKGCLMVVADGMGGMNAGEIASKIAIDTVRSFFSSEALTDSVMENAASIEKYMKKAIVTADSAIKAKSREDSDTKGMGTTVVIAWLLKDKAYISWCGDSRAYAFHPQGGIKQLSRDHSYVQELVDSGKLKPEYAFDHPDSNIITRSLGDPNRVSSPDFIEHPLHTDEIILLCSDGLCGLLRDNEIGDIIRKTSSNLGRCKMALIQGALDAGGYDNVTVALCNIVSGAAPFQADTEESVVASNSIKIKRKNLAKIGSFVLLLLLLSAGIGWYLGSNTEEKKEELTEEKSKRDSTEAIVPVKPDTLKKDDKAGSDEKKAAVTNEAVKAKADAKVAAKKIKEKDTTETTVKQANKLVLLWKNHTVAKGETITSISKKYAVSEDDLLKWNDIPKARKDSLQEGVVLKIKNAK